MQHILDVNLPEQNPTGAPGGDFEHIDSNPNMFGALGAKAEQQLGQGIEKAGNTAIEVATEQNQTQNKLHAADVKSWYADQTTDLHTKFMSLSGRAALDALPEYKKNLGDLRQQALDRVPSPQSKAMLNDSLTNMQDQYYRYWSGHAGGQLKTYKDKVAQDSIASSSALAVNSILAGDELGFERRLREQDAEVHNLFDSQGYDKDAMGAEVAKRRGATLKVAIETVAAGGDVAKAQSLFDKYKDRMDPASVLAVTANLKSGIAQLDGRNIADEVSGHVLPKAEAVGGVPSSFIAQVKRTEGFAAQAKWDVKQFSNGYGTKAKFDGETISKEEAEQRFQTEFAKATKIVDAVNPNLDPGTRAALSSLTYNAGEAWTHAGLGEKIRAGDLAGAKELFLQYNKADGATSEGLATRRYREAQWFGANDAPAGNGPLVDKQSAYERVLARTDNNPLLQTAAISRLNQVYAIYHTEQTGQNAAFDRRLEDSQAEALATGTTKAPLNEPDFVNRYGVTDGRRQYGEYQKNLALGADISGLATMSPEEQNQVLAKHTPVAGSEGFATEQTRQQAIQEAIKRGKVERDKDPAAFAIARLPAVSSAASGLSDVMADKESSPKARAYAAANYANITLAEQARVGVPADARAIVTAEQVRNIGGGINLAATSDDPVARQNLIPMIKAQSEMWGSYWPEVAQQILPNAAPIVKVIAAGADPDAMLRVLSIPKGEDPPKILKEQNEVTARNMNNALNVAMAPFLNSMVGLQKDRDYKGYHDVAEKLAALYVRDGKGAEEAAQAAFDDIVGKRYTFADTYRIPKAASINPDDVQRGAYEARENIKRGVSFEDNLDQAKTALNLNAQEQALYQRHLSNLKGEGGVDNPDGSRSSLKNITVESDGKTYVLPTVYDGKIVSEEDAWKRAKTHLSDFPAYASEAEAAARYTKMHEFMDKDTANFMEARRQNPFGNLQLQVNDIGVSDNEADSRSNYYRNGTFVTSPKNDGLNVAYHKSGQGMTFLKNAAGEPILLTWDQLQKMGGTREARSADAARATLNSAATPLMDQHASGGGWSDREAEGGGATTSGSPRFEDFRRSDNIDDRRHESNMARHEGRVESGWDEKDLGPELSHPEKTALGEMLGLSDMKGDGDKFRERKQQLYDEVSRTIRKLRRMGSDLPLPQHGRPYVQGSDE